MNEELTREVLEVMKGCCSDCSLCGANEVCGEYDWPDTVQALATALLSEMDKQDVFTDAPGDAKQAQVTWFGERGVFVGIKTYCRELPKTRARQISENIVHGINGETHGETKDIEYVEGVLTKYAEELEGKE